MNRETLLRYLPLISGPVLVILLVSAWKLGTAVSGVSDLVLPPPEAVAKALFEIASNPDVWLQHVWITVLEAVAGFVIALLAGVVTGVVLGRVAWLERALRPVLVSLQVTPKVALIPLFVIWFGFGIASKIVTAAMLAYFPIMLNVVLGVRSVTPAHRDVMRSLEATRWQTFRMLDLHSTLPYVLAGMEVGVVFAVIGAIVGEYLGGNQGLGYLVVVSLNELDVSRLFAVIVLLALVGLSLYVAVGALKRILIPWHVSVRESINTLG